MPELLTALQTTLEESDKGLKETKDKVRWWTIRRKADSAIADLIKNIESNVCHLTLYGTTYTKLKTFNIYNMYSFLDFRLPSRTSPRWRDLSNMSWSYRSYLQ